MGKWLPFLFGMYVCMCVVYILIYKEPSAVMTERTTGHHEVHGAPLSPPTTPLAPEPLAMWLGGDGGQDCGLMSSSSSGLLCGVAASLMEQLWGGESFTEDGGTGVFHGEWQVGVTWWVGGPSWSSSEAGEAPWSSWGAINIEEHPGVGSFT